MRPFRPTSTERLGSSLRAWGRARDGGVAVTVAVMTTVLVGVLVLSIDAARIYNAQTERNNAADAAAIAAGSQLDGLADACTRAIDAAVNTFLTNQETFTSNRTGADVFVSGVGGTVDGGDPTTNPNIRFLSQLLKDNGGNVTGTYINNAAVCDSEASFVEVTLNEVAAGVDAQVEYYFAGLVGALTEASPRGYAIAEYSKAFCNVPPMMMCALDGAPNLPPQAGGGPQYTSFMDAVNDYALTGHGLLLKSGTNSTQWGPGNFGFLRLGGVGGAQALGELIGSVTGNDECFGTGEVETEPGNNSGARQAFNTRFDMYHGSFSSSVGDPNYQPAANTVKGLMRSGGSCGWGGGGYGDPPNKYDGSAVPLPEAMPFPMDNCAYGGGCTAVDNLGRLGDGNWDRDTYFSVNHGAGSWEAPTTYSHTDLLNGCGTEAFGFEDADYDGGGAGPFHPDCSMSRYEAYLWELDRPHASTNFSSIGATHHLVDNTVAPTGPPGTPQNGEHAGDDILGSGPQCYTGDLGTFQLDGEDIELERDRRVVPVLVLNCDPDNGGIEIKGKTEIPLDDSNVVLGSVELFVLEPWQVNGGEHQISTEIIGPAGSSFLNDAQPDLIKEWVNLKESRQHRPDL